jgi:hypothetical protein
VQKEKSVAQARALALKEEDLALRKQTQARNDVIIKQFLADAPAPEEFDKGTLVQMLFVTYKLALANTQIGAAVSSVAQIADIQGFKITRTEIGAVDEFDKTRTREDVFASIERKMGKDGASIFREIVDRYERRGQVVDAQIIEDKIEESDSGEAQDGIPAPRTDTD